MNGLFIPSYRGDIAISDDDSTLYVTATDASNNGYLCIYSVK